jgi:hypothetical protein
MVVAFVLVQPVAVGGMIRWLRNDRIGNIVRQAATSRARPAKVNPALRPIALQNIILRDDPIAKPLTLWRIMR